MRLPAAKTERIGLIHSGVLQPPGNPLLHFVAMETRCFFTIGVLSRLERILYLLS
jgi:hypothetical protein